MHIVRYFKAEFIAKNTSGFPSEPGLRKDVTDLYNEVIHSYDKYTNADEVQDVDALGNIVWKDPDRPTRNYWGFTLDGFDKRKELAKESAASAKGYGDFGQPRGAGLRVNHDVERARALAGERGREIGRGRGTSRGGWLRGRGGRGGGQW